MIASLGVPASFKSTKLLYCYSLRHCFIRKFYDCCIYVCTLTLQRNSVAHTSGNNNGKIGNTIFFGKVLNRVKDLW